MPVTPVPTIEECADAVAKAVAARRAKHAPLDSERVQGVTLTPRFGRDNWWFIGRVFDAVAGVDFSVWYMLPDERRGRGRVGVGQPNPPTVDLAATPAVTFSAN